MSSFNKDQFLATESTSKLDTYVPSIPAGEYQAQITKLAVRTNAGKDKESTILDVTWDVLDENVKDITKLDSPSVRQSIFLDLTPEGNIDYGKAKNVSLGKLREALGMNHDGKPWSPNRLVGSMATIVVEQSENPNNPENPYSNVVRVAPL